MQIELVFRGSVDDIDPLPDTEALTACLIFKISSVKKEAKLLHDWVDKSLRTTDMGNLSACQ